MTEAPRIVDQPEPGLFQVRMVRGGVPVAARIWRPCSCTVNGPDTHDWQPTCDRHGPLVAEVNGFEKPRYSAVWWVWLSGRRIDRKMYDYLLADAEWCRMNAPDEPRAKPWRLVNINRTAPAI